MDAQAAFREGFSRGLDELMATHKVLWDTDEQTARELGVAAANVAVGPVLWREAVGDTLPTDQVVRRLAVSRQALWSRLQTGSLIGLRARGRTEFPEWQFEGRAVRSVVAEIVRAFRRHDVDDYEVIASWATTPQPEDLDGVAPEEWVRDGRDDETVVEAARRAAARLGQ